MVPTVAMTGDSYSLGNALAQTGATNYNAQIKNVTCWVKYQVKKA